MPPEGLGGRIIDGRFELLERLGGGGMGLVWRARDTLLRREVALKEVRAPFGNDAGWLRERVLREAQALARLHHPNVVTIHHIVDSPGLAHPWLVMELVTGGSLQDRLKHLPLSPAEAVRIGRGVLAALRAAHATGILHRDVKPGNVLLRPDGTPVLTDFGIAAIQEAPGLTTTGTVIGSPEYMAPERLHGQEGNPASDLWSLGMLLYVALEGRHPLRRETTVATIAAVMGAPIPPPVRSGPLAPVLSALLNRDPALRANAATAERMLAEAEHTLDRTPAPPMDHQQWDTSTGARPRGGRLLPALVAALVVAVVSTGAIVLWKTNQNPAAQQTNALPTSNTPEPGPAASTRQQEATGSTTTGAPTAPAQDLLTPQGIRALIKDLEQQAKGTRVVSLTAYPTYASIDVVKAGDPKLYDSYTYRDGRTEFDGPGGTLDEDQNTIELNTVNWDALPALIKQADTDLNVPNPTTRYFILESELISQRPELRVYVADDYGGAYLGADLTGKVTKKSPRGR